VLAVTALAGEAFARPGGGGRGRGGRQGWGRGMASRPRMGANLKSVQPDGFWGPRGPYCPFGQGPYQNIRGRQGRGQGGFGQSFQGRSMAMQGRAGRGYQGRGTAMQGRAGRGFRGRGTVMQGRAGRGYQGRGTAMQGRVGRGFQGRGTAPQGWGMNGRRGQFRPDGIARPGPGIQPRRFAPGDTGRPMPPRERDWAPGRGQGWRPGPQPEKPQDE
jgi:hypothetical protein